MRRVIALTGAFVLYVAVLAVIFPVEASNIPSVWTAPLLIGPLKVPTVCGYAFQEGLGPLICGRGPVENAPYRRNDGYYVIVPQKLGPAYPSAEQQKRFQDVQEVAQRAGVEWKAASDRADALSKDATLTERINAIAAISDGWRRSAVAGSEVRVQVFYIMAQMKISPDEYDPKIGSDGKLQFTPKETPK